MELDIQPAQERDEKKKGAKKTRRALAVSKSKSLSQVRKKKQRDEARKNKEKVTSAVASSKKKHAGKTKEEIRENVKHMLRQHDDDCMSAHVSLVN